MGLNTYLNLEHCYWDSDNYNKIKLSNKMAKGKYDIDRK